MTSIQKIWVRFKTRFIMAYHKLKKQSKNQVNNIMTGDITVLIDNELQIFSTQFNEVQQQLANFSWETIL